MYLYAVWYISFQSHGQSSDKFEHLMCCFFEIDQSEPNIHYIGLEFSCIYVIRIFWSWIKCLRRIQIEFERYLRGRAIMGLRMHRNVKAKDDTLSCGFTTEKFYEKYDALNCPSATNRRRPKSIESKKGLNRIHFRQFEPNTKGRLDVYLSYVVEHAIQYLLLQFCWKVFFSIEQFQSRNPEAKTYCLHSNEIQFTAYTQLLLIG